MFLIGHFPPLTGSNDLSLPQCISKIDMEMRTSPLHWGLSDTFHCVYTMACCAAVALSYVKWCYTAQCVLWSLHIYCTSEVFKGWFSLLKFIRCFSCLSSLFTRLSPVSSFPLFPSLNSIHLSLSPPCPFLLTTHLRCSWPGRASLHGKSSLRIDNVRSDDQGWYECKVLMLEQQYDTFHNGSWVHLTVNGKNHQHMLFITVQYTVNTRQTRYVYGTNVDSSSCECVVSDCIAVQMIIMITLSVTIIPAVSTKDCQGPC